MKRTKPLMWEYRYGPWGRHLQRSPALAMRDGDWKLVRLPDRLPMLYNLKEDFSQSNNIADQHPEVAERLGARLRGAVRGRDEVVELVLIALLADGHLLYLTDLPTSGVIPLKTFLPRRRMRPICLMHGGFSPWSASRNGEFDRETLW